MKYLPLLYNLSLLNIQIVITQLFLLSRWSEFGHKLVPKPTPINKGRTPFRLGFLNFDTIAIWDYIYMDIYV